MGLLDVCLPLREIGFGSRDTGRVCVGFLSPSCGTNKRGHVSSIVGEQACDFFFGGYLAQKTSIQYNTSLACNEKLQILGDLAL